MKDQDQIKAIAELDGWHTTTHNTLVCGRCVDIRNQANWHEAPPYLTSRDAIVPVIEKQSDTIQLKIYNYLDRVAKWTFLATAPQLCEALLRATGKWKE